MESRVEGTSELLCQSKVVLRHGTPSEGDTVVQVFVWSVSPKVPEKGVGQEDDL